MNVLFLNGSSHVHGTTMRAIEEMIHIFDAEGVETEVFQTGAQPLPDCLQCGYCQTHDGCVIKDDGVNEFVEKAKTADAFIFASPVYFAHPSGRIYSFMDRAFFSRFPKDYEPFRFKPAAAIAVGRRGGTTAALDGLNKYFGLTAMPVVGSTYWNMVHGYDSADAPQDQEGLQTMRNLARNMIWLVRAIEAGKKAGIPYPQEETGIFTNFVRRDM